MKCCRYSLAAHFTNSFSPKLFNLHHKFMISIVKGYANNHDLESCSFLKSKKGGGVWRVCSGEDPKKKKIISTQGPVPAAKY